jgi:HEAT repeat protein
MIVAAVAVAVLLIPQARETAWGLMHTDTRGTTELIGALGSSDETTRREAAKALGNLGSVAPGVIPALVKTVSDDKDAGVRVQAGLALTKLHVEDESLAAPLSKALNDEIQWVRMDVVLVLSRMGHGAKDAVPALVGALGDKANRQMMEPVQKSVFDLAIETLGKIGPDAKEAVPALSKIMTEKDIANRVNAAESIWKINKDLKATMPVFLEGLKSEDFHACDEALDALEIVGANGKEAVPLLTKILADKERTAQARGLAAKVLGNMGPEAKAAVPALVAGLDDFDHDLQDRCVFALGAIGPEAKSATPKLVRMAKEGNARVSKATKEALAKIDPQAAGQTGSN